MPKQWSSCCVAELFGSIRVLRQYERGVGFNLGKFFRRARAGADPRLGSECRR